MISSHRHYLIKDFLIDRAEDGAEFTVDGINMYLMDKGYEYTGPNPKIGIWMTLRNDRFIEHMRIQHKVLIRRVDLIQPPGSGKKMVLMRAEKHQSEIPQWAM